MLFYAAKIGIIPETSKKKHKKLRSGELRSIVIRQQESKVERHDMSLLCRYVIIRSTIFELYHYRLISPTPPNLFLRDNG